MSNFTDFPVADATWAELVRAGLSQHHVRTAVRDGGLERVSHGVYLRVEEPGDDAFEAARVRHLREAAAFVRALPGSYLVGPTACVAHGLPLLELPERVSLARAPRLQTRRSGVDGRRAWVHPVELHPALGVMVQHPTAAVVEVAGHEGAMPGLVVADAAARLGLLTDGASFLAAWGKRAGVGAARRALELADGRRESVLESIAAWQALSAGVVLDPQTVIRDAVGEWLARVDFTVRGAKVIVEVDGIGKYRGYRSFKDERVRHNQIEELGWIVIRVTVEELRYGRFVPRLLAAIARAERV